METLDQNELATAYYDPKNKIIVFETSNILVNTNVDKIEALLKKAISASGEFPVVGEIVNLTHLRGNFNKIIPFLTKEYYPTVSQKGMKKAAYVVSNDFLSKRLVDKIIHETDALEVKAFADLASAEKWVTDQK